jgi:antitoxin ParD1/3/4/toxin ParE1/3/4
MKEYILSHDAQLDLIEALDYVDSKSEKAAIQLERHLLEAFLYLSDWPGTGHPRDDSPYPSLRFWTVEGYVIAYDPDSVPLAIHAIVHGARDLGTSFIVR